MNSKMRCRHPDCIYRTNQNQKYIYDCDYLAITVHSRIAGLSPEEQLPGNCRKYVPANGKPRRGKATKEDGQWHDEARRLNAEGLTNAEIGKKLGTRRKNIEAYFNSIGIKSNTAGYLSGWDWRKAERLWERGVDDHTVAEEIGCDISMIRKHRKRKELLQCDT